MDVLQILDQLKHLSTIFFVPLEKIFSNYSQ